MVQNKTFYIYLIYGLVVSYALCYQFQRPIEPFLIEKLVFYTLVGISSRHTCTLWVEGKYQITRCGEFWRDKKPRSGGDHESGETEIFGGPSGACRLAVFSKRERFRAKFFSVERHGNRVVLDGG